MVMAPNGTLITPETAEKMATSGIRRISASIDGATKDFHDKFRGVDGAFDAAIQGIEYVKAAGIEFQINTTITKTNLDQIPRILELADGFSKGPPCFNIVKGQIQGSSGRCIRTDGNHQPGPGRCRNPNRIQWR